MREEKFLDAMSFLDEELIEEANQVRQGKSRKEAKKEQPLWMKWRKGIAVIAAIYLVSLGLSNMMTEDKGELIYGEPFEGYGGCGSLYSEENLELVNDANPWRDNGAFIPATLPVYKNLSYSIAGEPSGITDEQMINSLKETAGTLGLEVTHIDKDVSDKDPERVYCYHTTIGNTGIEVEADGQITISYKESIEVKDDYVEVYGELLGFEEPVVTESLEGNYVVFDGKGTLEEDMLNYFFGYAEFYTDEEDRLLRIRIHNELMATQKLGDYFYISEEEAKEKLFRGEFYTNSGYGIYKNSPIVKTDLVYINSRLQEYFMPYYRFYIEVEEEGLPKRHNYGLFYVPAVDLETSAKLQ